MISTGNGTPNDFDVFDPTSDVLEFSVWNDCNEVESDKEPSAYVADRRIG
jgi:hypothetical protein